MLIPSSVQCKDQCLAFATLLDFFIPITVANVSLYSQVILLTLHIQYNMRRLSGGPQKDMSMFQLSESLKVTLFGKRVFSDVIKLMILR